jgi:hypothetical protein
MSNVNADPFASIRRTTLLIAILLYSLFLPFSLLAETYYVRPSEGEYWREDGSDYANAFDGWSDIIWGKGPGMVGPGDTLYVCGRLTNEYVNITADGTKNNRIVIRGDYISDPGIIHSQDKSKAIRLDDAHFITIMNLTASGAVCEGVGCQSPCTGLIIDGVTSHHNNGSGFGLSGNGLVLRNSTSYANKHSGIRVTFADNAHIFRCDVYDNGTVGNNNDGIFVGNGSTNFLIEECIVSNQKGQSSYDVSGSKGRNGTASGTFRGCTANNGPTFGFHSAINHSLGVLYYDHCNSSSHQINFQAGLFKGSKATFTNCIGYGNRNDAGWAIQGRGERHITIRDCTEYAETTSWVIKIGDLAGLTLLEENNNWHGGKIAFAKIDGKSKTWAEWQSNKYSHIVSRNSKFIRNDSNFMKATPRLLVPNRNNSQ